MNINEQVLFLFVQFGGLGAVAYGIGFSFGALLRLHEAATDSPSSMD